MTLSKRISDIARKHLLGEDSRHELEELRRYFSVYGPINFDYHREDGIIVAVSTDFRHGTIITNGRNELELDRNIRDAILSMFGVSSAFQKEAGIHNVNDHRYAYVAA